MSGGHFEYNQRLVHEAAEDIEKLLASNDDETHWRPLPDGPEENAKGEAQPPAK